jgi:hypothetical protein
MSSGEGGEPGGRETVIPPCWQLGRHRRADERTALNETMAPRPEEDQAGGAARNWPQPRSRSIPPSFPTCCAGWSLPTAAAGNPGGRRRAAGQHGRVDADAFIRDGYVCIRGAVDAGTAAACRQLIWQSMSQRGIRPDDSASWPPLARIDNLDDEPFRAAAIAPALTAAYDELIGPGRWTPRVDAGRAVMVRFPGEERANAGYHIEGSNAARTGPARPGSTSGPGRAACWH